MNQRLLITGARGFIGSTVGRVAAEQGWEIHGLGRAAQPPTDWLGGYAQCDVANTDLREAIDSFKPRMVFHGAGSASVGQSFGAPLDDFRASVLTFSALLDAVRRSETKPLVIFPSSAAVYGQPLSLPVDETHPCQPMSPYGMHKRQAELSAESYCRHFGLNVVSCRIFSAFGPAQRRLLVWELFQQVRGDTETITLKGTGEETRDFLYADDLATAMLSLGQAHVERELGFHAYNVAGGQEVSVLTMVQLIQELLGQSKPVRVAESTPSGDPARWMANIDRLHKTLPHFHPPSLQERLDQTLSHWRGHA